MKFMKFGKAVLMGAISAGVIFGASSCVESYTTGYLYVTGTVTAQPNGNGIVTGFRIDHNTGQLTVINGLPVGSGGANPVRAVLSTGSRFLYVLNRGTNSAGTSDCTTADPCTGANIEQFTVGGNGILTPQETFDTQGLNPFRMMLDSSGNYLLVLDHDSSYKGLPSSASNPNPNCGLALGGGATTCGDVTVFGIDATTGRLSLIENAQVTAANGAALTYFPVPANPVEFVMSGGYLLTLFSTTAQTSYPYTGGAEVFPYAYTSTSGQLTLSQSSSQSFGIAQGTEIISQATVIYILDNEPITYTPVGGTTSTTAPSQILPFTVGANGALQAEPSGIIPDDPTLSNPIQLLVESKGKYIYVANQGSNTTGNNPESGIAGYEIFSNPNYETEFIDGEPFGSGSGPQCIVEDPSDQYIYTANEYDSSVTGRVLDPNSGVLNDLRTPSSTYTLQGPASWCLIDGRTG